MTDQPTRITAPFLDVLETFLAAGGKELHGWAIIKTSQRGGPTVYKILERLTDMEWVTARWDDKPSDPNKPRRRYYKLTGEGAARGRALLAERRPQTTRSTLRPAFGGGSL
jgi:PadR family transcriptional regulator, regulatory protein PadR